MRGSRESDFSHFSGALPVVDIFSGGWKSDTTVDNLKDYCKNNLKVNIIECIDLESKSAYNKSSKIKLDIETGDKIMKAECWPKWVFVRKFYKPRRAVNNENKLDKIKLISYKCNSLRNCIDEVRYLS